MPGLLATLSPDWIQAIAAGVSALVTVLLVGLAVAQMIVARRQASAAAQQVQQMREDAQQEAQHRKKELQAQAGLEGQRDEAVRTQLRALGKITEATRDAAHAQVQPIVFAHALGPHRRGPDDEFDLAEGQVAFPYYLRNEGLGTALNVRHGVTILHVRKEFEEGMQMRALRAGETAPPLDQATQKPLVVRTFYALFDDSELPANWERETRIYWTHFEDPFGATFEIGNPDDPYQPAALMQVTELPGPS